MTIQPNKRDSTLSSRTSTKKRSRKNSKCCQKCRKRREKKLEKKREKMNNCTKAGSRSRSRSWTPFRERSRSISIPIDPNRTSPSFLEVRRITSARKLPIPYRRKWTSDENSEEN